MKFPIFGKGNRPESKSALAIETIQSQRERILNNVLIGAMIFGLVDYFLVVIRTLETTPLFAKIIYTGAILWITLVCLIHFILYNLPFWLRAISVVGLIYLLGVTSYFQGGVTTDGAIFVLGFIAMTSILFGARGALVGSLLGVSSVAAIGILMSMKLVAPTNPFASDNASGWINRGAVLVLMSAVVSLSLSTLVRGLQKNLTKATEIASELEKEQEYLRQHSQDLERRSVQIRTAAEISRSISGVMTPQKLLQDVVDLVRERFSLYYAGVFLIDDSRRYAVLQAGTGAAGTAMVAAHHRLPIGESSMISWTITHRQPRIALDVGQDAVRFANPNLPNTRSELALPLISSDRVIGALTIQSEQPEAFDQDDITILQNIADTLAVAMENARLFTELDSNLSEIRSLHSQYLLDAWNKPSSSGETAEYSVGSQANTGESNIIRVPLSLREQTIGQLTLETDADWTQDEQGLIEAVASQAALALENARLLEESQQLALHERLTADITGKIWSSPSVDTILQTAIRELGRALRADEATIELKID
jgi:GAF domain-containing protein